MIWRARSIRWKIIGAVLLGLALPVLGASWVAYRTAQSIIRRHSIEEQGRVLIQLSRDFLQQQDIGCLRRDHVGNAHGVVAAIEAADTLVHVPADDSDVQWQL